MQEAKYSKKSTEKKFVELNIKSRHLIFFVLILFLFLFLFLMLWTNSQFLTEMNQTYKLMPFRGINALTKLTARGSKLV